MSNLASLNSATLGVEMPVVTLPDGSQVQTGTVGALLVNIRKYDQLLETGTGTAEEIQDTENQFKTALPLLKKVGLFSLFPPEDWIKGTMSAGRKRVGELFLESEKGASV